MHRPTTYKNRTYTSQVNKTESLSKIKLELTPHDSITLTVLQILNIELTPHNSIKLTVLSILKRTYTSELNKTRSSTNF